MYSQSLGTPDIPRLDLERPRRDATPALALSALPGSDSQPDASASTAELPEAEIMPPRRLCSRRHSAVQTCAAARAPSAWPGPGTRQAALHLDLSLAPLLCRYHGAQSEGPGRQGEEGRQDLGSRHQHEEVHQGALQDGVPQAEDAPPAAQPEVPAALGAPGQQAGPVPDPEVPLDD